MQSRTGIALIFIASLSGPGGGEAQTADCDPNTRACFDIRIDLPLASEPAERVGYERPTVNRYQAQEAEIYRQLRMDYTPYTCSAIGGEEGLSNRDDQQGTDVEHIVALAEAHDSGLKAEDMLTFSGDPLNLTLAMPYENRTVKSDRDAADFLPEQNQCWFAGRVIAVKQKWGLSVDTREAHFLKTALSGCTPEQIAAPTCEASSTTPTASHPPIQTFANCAAMRSAGWSRGVNHDGGTYEDAWDDAERETYTLNTARDRDKDGRACEA